MSFPYVLLMIGGSPSIRCLLCNRISDLPTDVENRYCGRCHLQLDVVAEARAMHANGATHDCGEWRTFRDVCAICGETVRRVEPFEGDLPVGVTHRRFELVTTHALGRDAHAAAAEHAGKVAGGEEDEGVRLATARLAALQQLMVEARSDLEEAQIAKALSRGIIPCTEDEDAAALTAELALHEAPITFVLRPSAALQIAELLQLALRHPLIGREVSRTAHTFVEHVRQYFAGAPTISAILRRNDLPAEFELPPQPEDNPALYDIARQVTHGVGLPWTDPRSGITYPPPPLAIRVRYRRRGGHMHCRFFTATKLGEDGTARTTFEKCGDLVFSLDEWPALQGTLATAVEFLEEAVEEA